jgi:hypothetical protein
MRETLKTITWYIAARARETSTWQALILIATAAGIQMTEEQKAAVVSVGLAIAGALSVFFPDRLGKPQSRSTDEGEAK